MSTETAGLFVITISSGAYFLELLDGDRGFGLSGPLFSALFLVGLSRVPSNCGIFSSALRMKFVYSSKH